MPTLPPNFLDELRARTPIQPLVARTVRLTRSGREQKGCCPFHGEKTPSFYVYDDHYHCFGCGEHGDVLTWVMKNDGASFMEAVEILAREAGMEVPKPTREAAEAEQKRGGIQEVLAAAAAIYQRWLQQPDGKPALDYLRGRGLTAATIEKFGLGWSGEGRGALAAALRGQNIAVDQLIEAGLMKQAEHGPVDMFFSRVMFPIRDRRGTPISFSGRILGDGQPKYVNGPETAVFSKRRSLYGLDLARDPVRKGAQLLVVEGQMDVIALAQAGFAAVAPLGTALTEEQLAEAWRLTPEPVICFDADAAGRRAALKTVDLALAALAPDRGLRFLRLPDKDDPDSLIRREGRAGFTARLATSQPLSAALYDMLAEGVVRATPEGQANFRKRLIDTASRIPDKILAYEYQDLLISRFFDERRKRSGKRNGTVDKVLAFVRSGETPASSVDPEYRRMFILTAIPLITPTIFSSVEESFANLALPESCKRMLDVLHDYTFRNDTLENESLFIHLSGLGLANEGRLIIAVATKNYSFESSRSPADAISDWWHFYSVLNGTIDMLRQQRDEQQIFWAANQDDAAAWTRLVRYNELLRKAEAGEYGGET